MVLRPTAIGVQLGSFGCKHLLATESQQLARQTGGALPSGLDRLDIMAQRGGGHRSRSG